VSDVAATSTTPQLGAVRSRRISPIILSCFLVVAAVIVMAVLGDLIAPQDPDEQDLSAALAKPSAEHWLGTDALGRDVTSRIVAGARSAFLGPLIIALGSALIGSILGLLAGYYGGRTDSFLMRYVDLMFALPGLLVIIVVAGAFGGGYWFSVGLLVILTMPFDLRMVRGATLEQVPRPYVEAAKTLGVRDWRIMVLHIWPNVSSVVVAQVFLGFAGALVALSGLSFLGLGVSPGTPDWGLMLSEGRDLLFANPVAVLAPAAAIVLTATCMNLIGDWSYERLASRGATR
jgi:peptide/nickel transport system permease protein